MVIIWKCYGYHSKSPRCAFGEATGYPIGNRDNTKKELGITNTEPSTGHH